MSDVDFANAEQLAREFHEAYERLAPDYSYKTREASAKPWEDVPQNNKELMIAVCAAVMSPKLEKLEEALKTILSHAGSAIECCDEPGARYLREVCEIVDGVYGIDTSDT